MIKEIQIKTIDELPTHQKEALKLELGVNRFNLLNTLNVLVELRVLNSVPHVDSKIRIITGTFADSILNDVNGGGKIGDVFDY
ncbi:MAG TPA: hypothetical protein VJH88_01530 [Candidatus Nanoarchaeia archaeon]|nr:hypothetical protein [Candidatus Nanoarchaeia archaeon]